MDQKRIEEEMKSYLNLWNTKEKDKIIPETKTKWQNPRKNTFKLRFNQSIKEKQENNQERKRKKVK